MTCNSDDEIDPKMKVLDIFNDLEKSGKQERGFASAPIEHPDLHGVDAAHLAAMGKSFAWSRHDAAVDHNDLTQDAYVKILELEQAGKLESPGYIANSAKNELRTQHARANNNEHKYHPERSELHEQKEEQGINLPLTAREAVKTKPVVMQVADTAIADPDDSPMQVAMLEGLLSKLPTLEREVIEQRHLQELSVKEIARKHNVDQRTINRWEKAAMIKLQELGKGLKGTNVRFPDSI